MDQAAFRTMLSTSKGSGGGSTSSRGPTFAKSRNVFAAKAGTKGSNSSSSKSAPAPDAPLALKPRHIKPSAPVEKTQLHSLLRDLTGHDIDETAHPGSAKGLDFSLLNRAREQAAEVDDAAYEDELEATFAGNGTDGAIPTEPEPTESKTRSDILAKLKASRVATSSTTEAGADTASKFKPIGFKPVGGGDLKKKKKKAEGAPEGERKKKKLKATSVPSSATLPARSEPPKASVSKDTPATTVELFAEEDLGDIFAGVDDYQGVDFGDSDDEAGNRLDKRESTPEVGEEREGKRGWFDNEPSPEPTGTLNETREPVEEGEEVAPMQEGADAVEKEEDLPEAVRLRPLASSSIPSVRDILAADDAIALEEKRKARREKRKKARE